MSTTTQAASAPKTEQEPPPIRITAEPTPNPASFKFTVDRPLIENGSVFFTSREAAKGSPLAEKLFEVEKVSAIFISGPFVTITKEGWDDWRPLAKQIGTAIRAHLNHILIHGGSNVSEAAVSAAVPTSALIEKIQEVLKEIRPFVLQDGGDIVFDSFEGGIVKVRMQGACSSCPSSTATLRQGIEAKLKERIPEVQMVVPV